MATIDLITSLLPIVYGVHVDDRNICILHDVIIGRKDCMVDMSKNIGQQNTLLRTIFIEELAISKSYRAGCKRFVPGSFVAYPEKYVDNPLVVDSSFIEKDKQVLLHVQEQSASLVIGVQSTIRIQRFSGSKYSPL